MGGVQWAGGYTGASPGCASGERLAGCWQEPDAACAAALMGNPMSVAGSTSGVGPSAAAAGGPSLQQQQQQQHYGMATQPQVGAGYPQQQQQQSFTVELPVSGCVCVCVWVCVLCSSIRACTCEIEPEDLASQGCMVTTMMMTMMNDTRTPGVRRCCRRMGHGATSGPAAPMFQSWSIRQSLAFCF